MCWAWNRERKIGSKISHWKECPGAESLVWSPGGLGEVPVTRVAFAAWAGETLGQQVQ